MAIRSFRFEQIVKIRANMRTVWTAVAESQAVRALRRGVGFVRDRWWAFCFTRRFYAQVCGTGPVSPAMPSASPQDLTERLFQRSLSSELHALVQLRVASQIASIAETTVRTEACRSNGWPQQHISAAIKGNMDEAFSEPEMLALRYADEITRTPMDVDPQTVKQLRNYFTQPELVELSASIAYENFRCRFEDARSRVR